MQFAIDESHIEAGIMNNEISVPDELQETIRNLREDGIICEKCFRQSVDGERFIRHVSLGINVLMIGVSSRNVVIQLDTSNFHQSVSRAWVEPGRFRIKDNFTHGF
jgi:hypothetical protein